MEEESEVVEWTPVYPEVEHPQPSPVNPKKTQPLAFKHVRRTISMTNNAKKVTEEISTIDGFIATAVVSADSGMALATLSHSNHFDIEIAAAANTQIIRAKLNAMRALKMDGEQIQDILITLSSQYYLIAPSKKNPLIFIYLALDKNKANLAMARHYLTQASKNLDI